MASFLMHYEDVYSDKVLLQQVTQLRDAAKTAKLGAPGAEDIVLRLMSQQIKHQHTIDTAADSLIVTAQAVPGGDSLHLKARCIATSPVQCTLQPA